MATLDARAPKVKVQVHRGDEWRVPILITLNDVAFDVSDYTFTAQIRKGTESTEVLDVTVDDADAATGELTLIVSDADTVTDPDGNSFLGAYFYDLQADHPAIGKRTWLRGTWVVTADVTRAA